MWSESDFLFWALPQKGTGERAASIWCQWPVHPRASHAWSHFTELGPGWEQADKAGGAAKLTCTSALTGLNHRRTLGGCTEYSSLWRYITFPFLCAYLLHIYSKVFLLGAAPACSLTVNYIARNTAAPTATSLLHYNYFLKMTLGPRYLSDV